MISYKVKISLNAKRVQCLKGVSELERIRVVAFPERRKNHREDQKEMIDVLSVFVLDQPDFIVVG